MVEGVDRALVPAAAGALVDVGAYLARLVRLDPKGVVRVRRESGGHLTLWATPLGLLTRRDVYAELDGTTDTTMLATELLARVEPAHDTAAARVDLPAARDAAWRASLPPTSGWELVDTVPGTELRRLAKQAADTVWATSNPTVSGEALLEHPVLLVRRSGAADDQPASATPVAGLGESAGDEVQITQRIVQVATRMGFVTDDDVRVATCGPWLVLAARNGAVYRRTGAPNLLTLS